MRKIFFENIVFYNRVSYFLYQMLGLPYPTVYKRDVEVAYDSSLKRFDFINSLIRYNCYDTYLEIGVCNPDYCFNRIKVGKKEGVDPQPSANATHVMTSDEFFAINKNRFDVIFIDGLHESAQVKLDVENALNALNDGGVIVCHDMSPAKESHQLVPRVGRGTWNGDCWRAWISLRASRDDLEMFVINADEGLGVIKKGSQRPLVFPQKISYPLFTKYRSELLNLVSVEQAEKRLFK